MDQFVNVLIRVYAPDRAAAGTSVLYMSSRLAWTSLAGSYSCLCYISFSFEEESLHAAVRRRNGARPDPTRLRSKITARAQRWNKFGVSAREGLSNVWSWRGRLPRVYLCVSVCMCVKYVCMCVYVSVYLCENMCVSV